MAATTLQAMTLGQQKMYLQQHSPQQNCVIVPNMQQNLVKGVIQGKRPLAPAPAPERSSVLVAANNADLRCKRKIQFMPYGGPAPQPASVARRNARERNRVKQVNNGFATLRQHIPPSLAQAFSPPGSAPSTSGRGASKKLSKVETLRLAVEYIRSLQQMIDDHESDGSSNPASDSMLDNRYYTSSPDSVNRYQQYPVLLPTPACSEASASPTPSQSSEGSLCTPPGYTNAFMYHHQDYENFEPTSPEDDEELLTAICLWQQQDQH